MRTSLEAMTGGWDRTELPDGVVVGDACYLEDVGMFERYLSTQRPGLLLGPRSLVYTWTRFSVEPSGRIDIGEECVLVGPQFLCASHIGIGPRTLLSYNVVIADCDFHPRDPDQRRRDAIATAPGGDLSERPPLEASPVDIGADVRVGVGAIILKGVRVGRGACVHAGAVVSRSVPDGVHVAGNPAAAVDACTRVAAAVGGP